MVEIEKQAWMKILGIDTNKGKKGRNRGDVIAQYDHSFYINCHA